MTNSTLNTIISIRHTITNLSTTKISNPTKYGTTNYIISGTNIITIVSITMGSAYIITTSDDIRGIITTIIGH